MRGVRAHMEDLIKLLDCADRARTTTAALGAVQEAAQSRSR